ncbi:MAG: polysaccharide biosynthesis/export family protein [Candidatus Omnitrophica bacterium]|nr:polysaccharide biosynthesis/export family protein [Candidatus Omnitrophota bacterium]
MNRIKRTVTICVILFFSGREAAFPGAIDAKQVIVSEFNKSAIGSGSGSAFKERGYAEDERLMSQQMDIISGDMEKRYIIVPGDTLLLEFYDGGKLNSNLYRVGGEGEIHIPLVGAFKIVGLSIADARDAVDAAISRYIRYPRTTLKVNTMGRVMIFGAVEYPGVISISKNLTAMEGILSLPGGYDKKTAELRNVIVIRGPVDKPDVIKLDLKKMITSGDLSDNILLKPGDIVYVPTSLISNVEEFIGTVYRYILTWYGLGGQNIIEPGQPLLGPYNGRVKSTTTSSATSQ